MLILSRKKAQSIDIDGHIRVTVVDTGNNCVKIGIQAPRDVTILRSELQECDFGEIDSPSELELECVV